jgi:hypothetical protein
VPQLGPANVPSVAQAFSQQITSQYSVTDDESTSLLRSRDGCVRLPRCVSGALRDVGGERAPQGSAKSAVERKSSRRGVREPLAACVDVLVLGADQSFQSGPLVVGRRLALRRLCCSGFAP